MISNPKATQRGENGKYALAKLALPSRLAGGVIGLVIGCFRVALEHMNLARSATIVWAHQCPVMGFVLVCAAFAAWLVQRSGQPAAGSGIPHVEAVIEGKLPAAPVLRLFAIGGRLALGREEPSVQIGANLAEFWGKIFRLATNDRLALFAAGAGAGLAVAFNAPSQGVAAGPPGTGKLR